MPLKLIQLLGLMVLVSGCMVGPDYRQPESHLPESWRSTPADQTPNAKKSLEQLWWRNFNDPVLNQLIAKAAENNLDIDLAGKRITEARAVRASASAVLLPSGDMMASANRQGNQLGFPGGGPINLSSVVKKPFNIFKAGFDASWELDLFGGHRREIESAQAELEAAAISQEDILVTTLAEVARTYFDIRLYQAQLQLAYQVVDSDGQTSSIAKERFKFGDIPESDVTRAAARQEHDQAQIAYYSSLLAQAEYSLDVLLGELPGAAHDRTAASSSLPATASDLVFAAPAQVIANRPDIRYAERKLASATAQQGVAVAKFFPDISLSGFIGLFNTNANNFFNMTSKSFAMSASVFWPILSYGTLSANLDAADARQQAALAQYQKTVLGALADVERAFTAYSQQEKYRQSLEQESLANQHLLEIAKERYHQGLTAYPEVLDAERSLFASRNQLAQAETQTAQDLVAVYKSLGGGWKSAADSKSDDIH